MKPAPPDAGLPAGSVTLELFDPKTPLWVHAVVVPASSNLLVILWGHTREPNQLPQAAQLVDRTAALLVSRSEPSVKLRGG